MTNKPAPEDGPNDGYHAKTDGLAMTAPHSVGKGPNQGDINPFFVEAALSDVSCQRCSRRGIKCLETGGRACVGGRDLHERCSLTANDGITVFQVRPKRRKGARG